MPTTTTTEVPAIVVGVEGSEPGLAAARWAATEAALRDAPLHIVHSYARPAEVRSPSVAVLRREAELVIAAAVTAARAAAPQTPVTWQSHPTPAAETLISRSGRASMIVVGHRGHGFGSSLRDLRSPVASAVAARANSPVAVVRPGAADAGSAGPIVVGVDGSTASEAALGFAFAEAALRHKPLRVIRAWHEPGPARSCPPAGGSSRAEIDAMDRWLCDSIQPWRDAFPHLPVMATVVAGRPFGALATASRQASLLVVGARGCGGVARLPIGSVSQQLIHLAACPVAVIRGVLQPDRPRGLRHAGDRAHTPAAWQA